MTPQGLLHRERLAGPRGALGPRLGRRVALRGHPRRARAREARRRGLSKDKVCVVVAIDSWGQALAIVSENGKPSTKRINKALKRHIRKGSTIVHDREKAHNALVRELGLVDERYKAVTTDPTCLEQMALVNHLWSWIHRYVERFACMRSENLQAYLDWFVYPHRAHRDEKKWPVEERVVRHLALSNGTYLRKW